MSDSKDKRDKLEKDIVKAIGESNLYYHEGCSVVANVLSNLMVDAGYTTDVISNIFNELTVLTLAMKSIKEEKRKNSDKEDKDV